jgi:hypothetical protein
MIKHYDPKKFRATNILYENETHLESDALIYSLGYEKRSGYIVEHFSDFGGHLLAVEYSENRELSFDYNGVLTQRVGATRVSDNLEEIEDAVTDLLSKIRLKQKNYDIAVDVSSMNRCVMATVLLKLYQAGTVGDRLRLLYAPAKFKEPNVPLLPLTNVIPAHPSISGVIGEPSMGRCVLLGLGYEYGVSLNILDAHEPDMSFIFRPLGFDVRYAESVEEANFGFDFGERNYDIIDYNLTDIANLYDEVNGIILSGKHNTQFTAVPFGPKIFSAVCIITAAIHSPHLAVLRYSMEKIREIKDVEAAGQITGCVLERVSDPGNKNQSSFGEVQIGRSEIE